MTDGAVELSLALCDSLGGLALRDLWREVALLARDLEFTSSEIIAHSLSRENARLRAALFAVCGADLRADKVGRVFARWRGVSLGGVTIEAIGEIDNAVLWQVQGQSGRTAAREVGIVVALPPTRRNAP